MNRRGLLKLAGLAVVAPAAMAAPAVPAHAALEGLMLAALESMRLREAYPQYVFVSPWTYEFLGLVEAGKPPYLAKLRADLNERRRREAMPPIDPSAFWGIDRSVEART